jgi:hypothetical protein
MASEKHIKNNNFCTGNPEQVKPCQGYRGNNNLFYLLHASTTGTTDVINSEEVGQNGLGGLSSLDDWVYTFRNKPAMGRESFGTP